MIGSSTTQFGKLLREFRKRVGLSQLQLGSYLAVSKSKVSKWETGGGAPPQDPQFYQRLREVPGFTDADITQLLQATEYHPAWFAEINLPEEAKSAPSQAQPEIHVEYVKDQEFDGSLVKVDASTYVLRLKEDLTPTVAETIRSEAAEVAKETVDNPEFREQMWLSNSLKARISTAKEVDLNRLPRAQYDILRYPDVDPGKYGIIWQQSTSHTVQSGEYLTSHTPDQQQQGDPSAAQGTKAPEAGLQPASKEPEQGQRTPRKGDISQRRTQFDNEYLLAQRERLSQRFHTALQNPEDPTHHAAKQGLHIHAQAMAEIEGKRLSQVAREHNMSLATLSRLVRDEYIPPLYRDRQAIYLANETTQKLVDLNHMAKAEGKPLASLVKAKRDELFPAEAVSQRRRRRERPARNQAEILVYEVVPTLSQAAEKTGVPPEEIVTTRDIQTEWNVNKGRVNRWTQGGPYGQPHLTPLPVRLGRERGGSQLLFRRSDVERLVADPPKGGRPREK
jgi:transcriptional regulator with XRE-family HTH domain